MPGPRVTAPTRLQAAPNAEERSMRIVIFFFISVIVKLQRALRQRFNGV